MKKGNVSVLGPRITVVSAQLGSFAEEVMREIAHPSNKNSDPLKNKRRFGEWNGDTCMGVVTRHTGEEIPLTLKLGSSLEGLCLMDEAVFSLKPIRVTETRIEIPLSRNIPCQRGSKKRNPLSIANNIIGALVVHSDHSHYAM